MNNIVLTGNLGNDPETIFTQDGMQVTTFSIAFKSTGDKTNWIKIVCFKKTAELSDRHLHKGARVGVIGILDEESWESDNGKKSKIKIIANSIEFIKTDGRGFEEK